MKKEVKWGVSETKKYIALKKTWGGKRVSTKPKKEATKVIRVRVSKLDEIKKINES